MKIYTKTGDDGTTGLFSGRRVQKSSSYLKAYGSVDELNSILGWTASICSADDLKSLLLQVQTDLHSIGADLATPLDAQTKLKRFADDRTSDLEGAIDLLETELEPLKNFILPGGSELASRLHIARCICRRVERDVYSHSETESVNSCILRYLNRLSDLLFVMARAANHRAKIEDVPWKGSLSE